jgi:CBS domain-containing protein
LIVDNAGQLDGILTQGDMARALRADPSGNMTVLNAGNRSPFVTYPDELVHSAVVKMLQHDVSRLPVVARQDPRRIVGYFGRSACSRLYFARSKTRKCASPDGSLAFEENAARRGEKARCHQKQRSERPRGIEMLTTVACSETELDLNKTRKRS